MRAAMVLVLLAGCFAPHPPSGAACTTQNECPTGLSCVFGICGGDQSDAPPAIGFATATSLEDETSGTVMIAVTLSSVAKGTVTVDYAVTGGTATRGADYTETDGTLSFAPGETEQQTPITILVDSIEEPDETIVLALSSPMGGTLGQSEHTVTISANVLSRVGFASAAASGAESSPGALTLTLDVASALPVSVDYALGGTATGGGVDYGLANGTITFPPGSTSQDLALGVVNDALDEDDETIVVTLSNPVNGKLGALDTETYTIIDDDAPPSVSFAVAASSVSEGVGTTSLTVSLSAPSSKTITVPFSSGNGTATNPDDYTYATTSPLVFPPGTTTKTIALNVVDDTLDEPDETVVTILGAPTNATLGAISTQTLTIVDNDPVCYGTGSFTVCLDTNPKTPVTLPAAINTDTSALCAANQPVGWLAAGQPASCVIGGSTIAMAGATAVTGSRPLVLVADDSITISDTLDVASHLSGSAGPGASSVACGAFPVVPGNSAAGCGGGAGGTFMSGGGSGGAGNNGSVAGGVAPASASTPSVLRAGCTGQLAGKSSSNNPGVAGRGGGAIYLVATNAIAFTATGIINASGAGATGGSRIAGGSGAGAGGMIVLFATAIDTTAGGTLIANGGAGAAGGSGVGSGASGSDPSPGAPTTPATGGIGSGGGNGGSGFALASPAGAGATGVFGSGGGGGGGGGGFIASNVALVGAVTSAGLVMTP